MSSLDTNNPFKNAVSEKQFNGYWIPNHNAKVIKAAIENGTAPFLPDQSGNLSAKPIYNANTGFCLNAKELIPLQIMRGEKSDIVMTYSTINKAGTNVREGEKGLFYNFRRDDGSIGCAQFFFPEQTENPEAVKKQAKINSVHKLNRTVEITSSEPEEYLATYVAACKSGANVKVSPEVAKNFVEKFTTLLDNQLAKGAERDKEMDTLGEFMFKVDVRANKNNKEMFAELKKEQRKSQTQTKEKDDFLRPIAMEMSY